MTAKDIFNEISAVCFAREDVSMKRHTSFHIGGPCDVMAEPRDAEELRALISLLDENGVGYFVMGKGTNLLVRDEGIRGVVIKIDGRMSGCRVSGLELTAGAGLTVPGLFRKAAEAGIAGFERISGIPGSVGGAVRMNAGAYDSCVADLLVSVTYFYKGELRTVPAEEADLSYRHSIFSGLEGAVITEAKFRGTGLASKEAIMAVAEEFGERRKKSQPLENYSAGSTFKRPPGGYASRLIDECGLKGFGVGDAEVSVKHAGFVINRGHATAEDVLAVMKGVQDTVFEKTGIRLEPEVIVI